LQELPLKLPGKMNCIVIDRNPASNKQLTDFISQDPLLKHKASCYTAFEALEVLQNQSIDLVFIDTQLTPISGINFIKSLVTRPLVILTSSDGQFAAEAFDLDATDYLIKPVSFERFFKSVQKAREIFTLKKLKTEKVRLEETNNEMPKGYILVKSDYNTLKINLEDILFVEGMKDYIKIYTAENKKPVITLNSLKKIQQALPPTHFSRIHKSFIISLDHITSINKAQVIIGENYIPIGESYKSYFLSLLEKRTI
jgi:DNA-binding LytR/AlgR family response regulator